MMWGHCQIAGNTKYRIPILIVLATGMRRGEVLGLRWEDFNSQKRVLAVRRSLSQTRTGVSVKEPKSGRARAVMVPRFLVDELLRHREEQRRHKAILRDDYTPDDGWVCADETGRPFAPKWLGNQFRRLARSANVDVTLHGLRHTQATVLIMSGVPVKVVSERLGHSTVNITQDIYAHVLPHMQEQAVEVLDGLFDTNPAPAETACVQNVYKLPREALIRAQKMAERPGFEPGVRFFDRTIA